MVIRKNSAAIGYNAYSVLEYVPFKRAGSCRAFVGGVGVGVGVGSLRDSTERGWCKRMDIAVWVRFDSACL